MARPVSVIRLLRNGREVAHSRVTGRALYTGRHWQCQLVDPANPAPRRKLLDRTWGGYRLLLPPEAEGNFTCKGSTLTLEDLVAWGLAKKGRKGYRVPYRKFMSARITFGGGTYILDTDGTGLPETRMEAVPWGHLPLRYRFQPPDRIDLTFLLILSAILFLQVQVVKILGDYPIPEVPAIRELPRRISRLILEPAAPAPAQPARRGERGVEMETPAEAETAAEPALEKPVTETPAPPGGTAAPPTRETTRSQVSKMGVLGVLTGRGTAGRQGGGSGISVLQLDAELQQDLESVLGEISGLTTSTSVAGTGGDVGFGGTQPGSGLVGIEDRLDGADVSGPIQVSSLGISTGESLGTPDSTGTGSPPQEDVPPEKREERSPRAIARIVAAHTGAIRYAYNRELRKKPSLRGKIVLTFTISSAGEVMDCRVEESAMNWPPLEEALVRMVRTWRFPQIPEGDVTVSYPLVFFPSM